MITIKADIKLTEEDAKFIRELQRQQSAVIRSAYVASSIFDSEVKIRQHLKDRFYKKPSYLMMDSWFLQSALYSGKGSALADSKLSITGRCYGGRKNFSDRASDKISSEDFKTRRLMPLYVIGEAPQSGNRKFNFTSIEEIEFKPHKGKLITINLPKFRKNYSKKLAVAFEQANINGCPITVSLTANSISFSFEEIRFEHEKNTIQTRYAGIDLNPNYVGVSVFDGQKLISTKMYSLKELTGKIHSSSKLEFETFEIGNNIVKMLRHFQVSKVFIEDLTKIRQAKGNARGKGFNRLCINQWKREKLLRPINSAFSKDCISINAAYTSTIGNALNENLPDPIAASTAIANRGYELIMTKSKKFYPELPEKKDIEDRWKKTNVPDFQDWKELHSWLKETGLKYRVDIPDISMFRHLSSRKSQVYVLDNFMYT